MYLPKHGHAGQKKIHIPGRREQNCEISGVVRAVFSSGGLTRVDSCPELPEVVGEIVFLEAVEFMEACFFKARSRDKERLCCILRPSSKGLGHLGHLNRLSPPRMSFFLMNLKSTNERLLLYSNSHAT